jgi:hypothetical protein
MLAAVPESHAGRLFDHVHVRVANVEASKRFDAGALAPLGLATRGAGEGWFSVDELFVNDDGQPRQDYTSPSRRRIPRP